MGETGSMSDLLQSLLGRAYGLSLTQGHHAAATPWGRGCLCGSSVGVRRGGFVCGCGWVGVCPAPIRHFMSLSQCRSRDVTIITSGLLLLAALQYVKY